MITSKLQHRNAVRWLGCALLLIISASIVSADDEISPQSASEEAGLLSMPIDRDEESTRQPDFSVEVEVDIPELDSAEDPSFSPYFELAELREAWLKLDVSRMVDLGLRLAEAERILLRYHKAIRSENILSAAASVAIEKRSRGDLLRLQKAAERYESEPLRSIVLAGISLIDQPRASSPIDSILQTLESSEKDRVNAFVKAMDHTRLAGDSSDLSNMKASLNELALPQGVKDALAVQLESALSASKQNSNVDVNLLKQLSADARGSGTEAIEGAVSRLAKRAIIKSLTPYIAKGSVDDTEKSWSGRRGPRVSWTARFDDPEDNLFVEIRGFKKADSRTATFDVFVTGAARISASGEYWNLDNIIAEGDMKARIEIKSLVRVKVSFVPKGGGKFIASVKCSAAAPELKNLVLDKIGPFGGGAAKAVSELLMSAVKAWWPASYKAFWKGVADKISVVCSTEKEVYNPIAKKLGL